MTAKPQVNRRAASACRPKPTLVCMAIALSFAPWGVTFALPVGAQVVNGQVEIAQPGASRLVINQATPSAIVNWNGFSIGAAERVDIRQPSTSSVILNRVVGGIPTEIYGRLTANGQVFLVNPSGVLFGRGAEVNVGSLIASSLHITNEDFLAGRYQFGSGVAGATVVNQGVLQAADYGTVALLGGQVSNEGTVSARLGTAALAAGEKISLDFSGDGLTKIRVDKASVDALVANRGMVIADGGQAILTVQAAQALTRSVLDQQGIVQARSLVERNGVIVLDGGDTGVATISGTLDASGLAAGRPGGAVDVLGHQVGLVNNAFINASGDAGGGSVRIGGDRQGSNPLVRNASAMFGNAGATIQADAVSSGSGGKVIVWSEEATRFHGAISAHGGGNAGDGGFVETSGKYLDVSRATVNASAARGKPGEWLLDPSDITIVSGNRPSQLVGTGPNFESTGSPAVLPSSAIEAALNRGTSVSVKTGAGGDGGADGQGNITISAGTIITKTTGADATLTLTAVRDIVMQSNTAIAASGNGGKLDVSFLSNSDGTGGAIQMDFGSRILTNGGNVLFAGGITDNQAATGSGSGFFGAPARPTGISMTAATIDTSSPGLASGAVTMRGAGTRAGAGSGVLLDGATITGGKISLAGSSVGSDSTGIGIVGASVLRAGDALSMAGTGVGGEGVYIDGATLASAGAIGISGTSGRSDGVSVNQTTITGNGPVRINGFGVGGVSLSDGTDVSANANSVSISGTAMAIEGTGTPRRAAGVDISASTVRTTSGAIDLFGSAFFGDGVAIHANGVVATSLGGAIDIRGRTSVNFSEFAPVGVLVDDATVAVKGGHGTTSISGEALGVNSPGIRTSGNAHIGGDATTGDITIQALNKPDSNGTRHDMIDLAGTIQTAGVVNLRPGGVSEDGLRTEAVAVPINLFMPIRVPPPNFDGVAPPATDFALNASVFNQVIRPGSAGVVVGSSEHTGKITAFNDKALPFAYDLTLQNGGAGSAGILLASGLSNPGRQLTLSSGGAVTQGGPVSVGSLLLHGTQPQSSFILSDSGNVIGRVSASFDLARDTRSANYGDVTFYTIGNLNVTPLTGTGFAANGNTATTIASPAMVVAHDVILQATQDIRLNQNIATLGSDITLVAGGVFHNPGYATLSPGGNGRWYIFADNQAGEIRGGLAGSNPTPNLYNCIYGAACAATFNAGGNRFIYRQQPVISVILDNATQSRLYGSANPAFSFGVIGLINGDPASAAVAGEYGTAAALTSNVGTYAVQGSFVSPVGYRVNVQGGSLTVNPAPLTYTASTAARAQGAANPVFEGSVSGFVAGDTFASATTGTARFTSTASASTPPGRYAIDGSGLQAANYLFLQAASNATALRVDGLPASIATEPFIVPPTILRDVTFASSDVYGKNFGTQSLCVGTGPLSLADSGSGGNDRLAIEWTRVKTSPNLSNCIALAQRYSCDSF